MAIQFTGANSEYYEDGDTALFALNGLPISVSVWFYPDSVPTNDSATLFQISRSDNSSNYIHLGIDDNDWSDSPANTNLTCAVSVPGSSSGAHSSNTIGTGQWYHGLGVWTSTSQRDVWVDGGNTGTDTDTASPSGTADVTSIGRAGDASPSNYFDGRIAELAVWNVALGAAEAAILAAGFSPLFVRPDALIAYWPLIRHGTTEAAKGRIGENGTVMAAANTPTVAAHPPMIYPAMPYIITAPTAPGGGPTTSPIHYYRRRHLVIGF